MLEMSKISCFFVSLLLALLQIYVYFEVFKNPPERIPYSEDATRAPKHKAKQHEVEYRSEVIGKRLDNAIAHQEIKDQYKSVQYENLEYLSNDFEEFWMFVKSLFNETNRKFRHDINSLVDGYQILKQEIKVIENSTEKYMRENEDDKKTSNSYKALWYLKLDLKNYWLQILSTVQRLKLNKEVQKYINKGYISLKSEIDILMDASMKQRSVGIETLKKFVRRKIEKLQNPDDCSKARILICNVTNVCGFGCETHSLANCLIQAFRYDRTLVYTSKGWRYAEDGWEHAFLPLGKCNMSNSFTGTEQIGDAENKRVIRKRAMHAPQWLLWSAPAELAPVLFPNLGQPFVWWISQFIGYIMRYNHWISEDIGEIRRKTNFKRPIAGIHVRRGDKVKKEAVRHEVEDYMLFVQIWFDQLILKNKNIIPMVYLATEDVRVLPQLQQKYPTYEFITQKILNTTTKKSERYVEGGLEGIITDIHFLSKCDYLVCTLSSSVCRTAYDLMTYNNIDGSTKFQSVDTLYRFKRNFYASWYAIHDHRPSNKNELELRIGDEIRVSLDPHLPSNDGFLHGLNVRTYEKGRFPAYKAREIINRVTYSVFHDKNDTAYNNGVVTNVSVAN